MTGVPQLARMTLVFDLSISSRIQMASHTRAEAE
jgi:hypothetical protein